MSEENGSVTSRVDVDTFTTAMGNFVFLGREKITSTEVLQRVRVIKHLCEAVEEDCLEKPETIWLQGNFSNSAKS